MGLEETAAGVAVAAAMAAGGGSGGDNTAAMLAVIAASTWCRQWHRGRLMWAEVIFCTYYYLHNSRVRTDVITIVRRMAKHKSVLRQNTFKTLLKSVLPFRFRPIQPSLISCRCLLPPLGWGWFEFLFQQQYICNLSCTVLDLNEQNRQIGKCCVLSIFDTTDVSQFAVRYEYLLLACPAKARR